ncbi:MAG TPA: hypothetical protein VNH63_14365 [Gemmatimonadales bacterium]|nr:hypothetical protein [Gemmatimonadales bacterium]
MRAVALLLVAATACAYDVPWTPGNYGPDGPFTGASPGKITLNPGADRTPAWLPGDTGVLYSVERGDPPHDRCFGVLSARQWTIERWLCHLNPAAADSVNAFEWPAVRGDGRLAYQRAVWMTTSLAPISRSLVVATLDRWDDARLLLAFPTGGGPNSSAEGARDVAWLDDTSLVFVREVMDVARNPTTGRIDTTVTPLDVERVDFGGAAAIVTVVPGTAGATSVAVNDSGTAIYYTLGGDTVVYRRHFAAGVVDTVYAFAAGAAPSDVQVRGARLLAIVAGDLHVVDLQARSEVVIPGPGVAFAHPALSASGRTVVVEGAVGSGAPDLWRVLLP